MTDRELMQMADRIEVLAFEMKAPNAYTPQFVMLAYEIREALRTRLTQPEPEPFGIFQYDIRLDAWVQNKDTLKGVAFYTAPPQCEWQGLTDEEIWSDGDSFVTSEAGIKQFARAIEAKLREKNAPASPS